jgi:hypothetical protein
VKEIGVVEGSDRTSSRLRSGFDDIRLEPFSLQKAFGFTSSLRT